MVFLVLAIFGLDGLDWTVSRGDPVLDMYSGRSVEAEAKDQGFISCE